jgi:hypothetical protein
VRVGSAGRRIIGPVNRTRAWLVVSPVVATGVLVAHALAYRVTGTPSGPAHDYLAHAPQVLLLLTLSSVALAGYGKRREAPAAGVFPVVALVTFVVQEHLESLFHDGGWPLLAASPTFQVGLVIQVPVALLAWVLARWLIAVAQEPTPLPSIRALHDAALVGAKSVCGESPETPSPLGRGPPSELLSR